MRFHPGAGEVPDLRPSGTNQLFLLRWDPVGTQDHFVPWAGILRAFQIFQAPCAQVVCYFPVVHQLAVGGDPPSDPGIR